jgi:hypothetical protein
MSQFVDKQALPNFALLQLMDRLVALAALPCADLVTAQAVLPYMRLGNDSTWHASGICHEGPAARPPDSMPCSTGERQPSGAEDGEHPTP